ncbi:sphingomyelin phosphodiesterase [Streptoalloteichus hindustanus]|uniref:Sphingomyelin phosphodiesterase n=1 Tax=Streptoalloteichus hindustanus TaxID=2017 RepID=A0A1M5Q7M4_STRHI|nr:sphingomyelin phosphodiesterase [Streptoalloteichus hindustanus]SHH10028.1 sphingomyelin phosphodiesterase [Streptoalloteichus hindustanus]
MASHNVFMLSRNLYPNWGQDQRADLIARQGVLSGQDVVVLQEAFDNEASARLLANLAAEYPHQTPVLGRSREGWDATTGPFSDLAVEDGGVSVVSRWPIRERRQHVFTQKCGAETFAQKGFAYVRLAAPSGAVHVIGTHLQAEDGGCDDAAAVRASQLDEIRRFVDERRVPAAEPVFVVGDLNVVAGSAEFDRALARLDARRPTFAGHPFSWDPGTNSVTAAQYPGQAPQHLDYVLPLNGHPVAATWTNRTTAVHSPKWTVKSWFREYTYTDFSDHYPVLGHA